MCSQLGLAERGREAAATKCLEKLNYMRSNSVNRGLVQSPEQWLWFSYTFCYLNDSFFLGMTRLV